MIFSVFMSQLSKISLPIISRLRYKYVARGYIGVRARLKYTDAVHGTIQWVLETRSTATRAFPLRSGEADR
jgi:hypothetical protein